MPPVNILVTGATGFIGGHLVKTLAAKSGVRVHALVRDPKKAARLQGIPGICFHRGDILDPPPLPPDLDGVFHLAGLTKALKTEDYYTVNRKGTARLFAALAGRPARPRIVLLSSLAAGGPSLPDGSPRKESDPPAPVSPYGKSKLESEEEALDHVSAFPLVILRVGAVYGPRDEDFLKYFRIVNRGIIPCYGRRARLLSLCLVDDLVTALELAFQTDLPSGEIFNIASPDPATWDEIGETAARILGRTCRHLRLPRAGVHLAAALSEALSRITGRTDALNRSKVRDMSQPGWVADVSKAERLLGFKTIWSLEAGLEKTLRWYRDNDFL